MKDALHSIQKGKSIRETAITSKIPYPTLRRYWKKFLLDENTRLSPNYYVKRIFTDKQELELKEYILTCSRMFYGLPIKECRCIAFEMATINKISIPQKWHKDSMAGINWMNNFRKRHPDLSLRTPEGCSLSRATFNAHNVNIFFDKLKELLARSPIFANETRIFNLDETGTITVQNPQKVLAKKGVKSVCKVTSAERGTLVTTCIIISASGQYLPPVIIFPRVHFKEHMACFSESHNTI
nr:uncharacterized protein LOC105843077 isoform X2 [Hydra vulgaris]